MNFGYVPITQHNSLNEADFTFDIKEQLYLPGKRFPAPKMYIGLPKWVNKNGLGLYTRQKQMRNNA